MLCTIINLNINFDQVRELNYLIKSMDKTTIIYLQNNLFNMAEGYYSSSYSAKYQADYLSKYNIAYYSRNGVRLMLIAITFYIFSHIFRATSVHIQSYMFFEISDARYNLAMALAWTSIVFVGIFIAIVLVSLYMFHLGRFEFNPQHTKNVKWSIIFMIGFIVISVLSIIISVIYVISSIGQEADELTSSAYYIYSGFPQAFYILQSFFLAFMILLVVKEFVTFRMMIFLYLVAGLIILIALVDSIIDILDPYFFNPETAQDFAAIIRLKANFIFIIALIWSLVALSYIFILGSLKTYGRTLPPKSLATRPILGRVIKYFRPVTTRPYVPFIAILIIAVIMGGAAAESAQVPRRLGIATGLPLRVEQPSEVSSEYLEESMLNEGESIDINININKDVNSIYFVLSWEDEPDEPLRDNNPDEFSMDVSAGRLTKSDESVNDDGGYGHITIYWDFGADDPYSISTAQITIKLEFAGDQEGPAGIVGSPILVEDNSNYFKLRVWWTYIEE